MLENEIDEKYANQIIDELDGVLKPNMPIDFMLSNVYQKMILKFGSPRGRYQSLKGPEGRILCRTYRRRKDHDDSQDRFKIQR